MFKLTNGDQAIRPTAGRVATTDDRYHVYSAGITIERPNDVRGDSVNELCVGARLDFVAEALAAQRAKSLARATAEQAIANAEAQAVSDVPVTAVAA